MKFFKSISFLIIMLTMPLLYSMQTTSNVSIDVFPDCSMSSTAIILYSGGLDSSAVTATFAAKGFKHLHLLTFDNGTQNHLEYSEIKLNDFRSAFSDCTFSHVVQKSQYLFKKLALIDIEDDFNLYHKNLICVGCKMAMHAHAIIYAIKNKIAIVADGFAKRQEDFPEQQECFLEEMKEVYKHYKLTYVSPLYHTASTKGAVKDILFRYGLSTKSIEPGCLFGGTFSKPTSDDVRAYFKQKTEEMMKFINEMVGV